MDTQEVKNNLATILRTIISQVDVLDEIKVDISSKYRDNLEELSMIAMKFKTVRQQQDQMLDCINTLIDIIPNLTTNEN